MNTKKILVADDNRSLCIIIQSALGDRYDVTTVGDGNALEGELAQNEYDLLITDLNMPHKSGAEVLRDADRVRIGQAEVDGLGIPTLVITGMSQDDDGFKRASRMVNVLKVFRKPLDLEQLRKKVDEILIDDELYLPSDHVLLSLASKITPRVLIVEDDPDIRCLLSTILESKGYQTRTCSSTHEGLRLCLEFEFDLICLDFVLQDTTADEFLEKIGADRKGGRLPPILVVSAFEDGMSMRRFKPYPQVKAIVGKPFCPLQFLDLVREHAPHLSEKSKD